MEKSKTYEALGDVFRGVALEARAALSPAGPEREAQVLLAQATYAGLNRARVDPAPAAA